MWMKENNWSIECLIKQQYCFVNGILVRITEVPLVFFERIDLYLYHKSYLYVWHERSCQGGSATKIVGSSTPGDGASGMTGNVFLTVLSFGFLCFMKLK